MKGYYYLAQAQLAINHPNEALISALTAYEACLAQYSTSTSAVSGLVLQAKKQKWEAKEKERIRGKSELLRELEDGIMLKKKEELQELKRRGLDWGDEAEEKADIELGARRKVEEIRSVFALADPGNFARRVFTLFPPTPILISTHTSTRTNRDNLAGSTRLPHRRHLLHRNARPRHDQDRKLLRPRHSHRALETLAHGPADKGTPTIG